MADDLPRKRGRPSRYTKAVADEICRRLADGETLIGICRDDHLPHERTVRGWALNNLHGFFPKYMQAREIGYLHMGDELMEIADDGSNDWMEKNDPENPGWVSNGEHIRRSILRVDTRKWVLAKALPKIFGDKVQHEHQVERVEKVEVTFVAPPGEVIDGTAEEVEE